MKPRPIALASLLGIALAAAGCNSPTPPAPPPAPAAAASVTSPATPDGGTASSDLPPASDADAGDNTATAQVEPPPPPPPPAPPQPPRQGPAFATNPLPAMARAPASAPPPPPPAPQAPVADEGEIVVMTAPPAPRVDRPLPPRAGYAWAPGYWQWDVRAHRHVWVAGTYVPARAGNVWVPARWVRTPRGWQFQPGHWAIRSSGAGRPLPPPPPPPRGSRPLPPPAVGITMPPPAPRIEPIVQRPGFVYATGFWRWDRNHYAWVPGHYEPLRPGYLWRQPHWSRNPDGTWQFTPGHWQRR